MKTTMPTFPIAFPWANAAFQSTMLAIEAQQVIAMRLSKLAFGAADARAETELMVSEKINALLEGGQMVVEAAMAGDSGLGHDRVIKLFRRKVRANRKRLGAR